MPNPCRYPRDTTPGRLMTTLDRVNTYLRKENPDAMHKGLALHSAFALFCMEHHIDIFTALSALTHAAARQARGIDPFDDRPMWQINQEREATK